VKRRAARRIEVVAKQRFVAAPAARLPGTRPLHDEQSRSPSLSKSNSAPPDPMTSGSSSSPGAPFTCVTSTPSSAVRSTNRSGARCADVTAIDASSAAQANRARQPPSSWATLAGGAPGHHRSTECGTHAAPGTTAGWPQGAAPDPRGRHAAHLQQLGLQTHRFVEAARLGERHRHRLDDRRRALPSASGVTSASARAPSRT
jgi:hypothetical protein